MRVRHIAAFLSAVLILGGLSAILLAGWFGGDVGALQLRLKDVHEDVIEAAARTIAPLLRPRGTA